MRHRYGPHFHQFGDLFLPQAGGPAPVAVVLHGGYRREQFTLGDDVELVSRPGEDHVVHLDTGSGAWAAVVEWLRRFE
jgi:hypothetical protein